jgi:AcrR family transcriptional regulator
LGPVPPSEHPGPIWTRPPRPAPRKRLTREAIVAAAIELADAEGLQAASIRRVAAKLETRPMGLYSHFERKDDLIDLMLDQIAAEILLDAVPADWREALRAIAAATRDTARRHPWMIEATSERTLLSPNGLRHAEQSLAAIAALALPLEEQRAVLIAVDTYTLGHVTVELAARRTQQRTGVEDGGWQAVAEPYLAGLVETGEFPHLEALGIPHPLTDGEHDTTFARGLEWLLDGIAASL